MRQQHRCEILLLKRECEKIAKKMFLIPVFLKNTGAEARMLVTSTPDTLKAIF